MLLRFLFLFTFILPTMAHADVWTCVTIAELSGDASYYWAYGRDSWSGPGRIECTSGRRTLRLKTDVRFEGKDPGIGASINSRLAFESMPVVTRAPGSLAQKMTVEQEYGADTWVSNGPKHNLNFLLYGNQLERFAGSTRFGNLDILMQVKPPKPIPKAHQ